MGEVGVRGKEGRRKLELTVAPTVDVGVVGGVPMLENVYEFLIVVILQTRFFLFVGCFVRFFVLTYTIQFLWVLCFWENIPGNRSTDYLLLWFSILEIRISEMLSHNQCTRNKTKQKINK